MGQTKVLKKDSIVINIILFLILSFFFVYIQHAYRHHLSPFSVQYFKKGLQLFWFIAVQLFLSMALIWSHHKFASVFFKISIAIVTFKVLEGLFIEFNKIIVIAMFSYLIIAYFLYQLLGQYLSLAFINPNYKSSDLFSPLLKNIECIAVYEGKEYSGFLTNWDENGCFLKLETPCTINSFVNLIVRFSGREFVQRGEVVASTLDSLGIGLKFYTSQKDLKSFNWSEFLEITEELGFQPDRLR